MTPWVIGCGPARAAAPASVPLAPATTKGECNCRLPGWQVSDVSHALKATALVFCNCANPLSLLKDAVAYHLQHCRDLVSVHASSSTSSSMHVVCAVDEAWTTAPVVHQSRARADRVALSCPGTGSACHRVLAGHSRRHCAIAKGSMKGSVKGCSVAASGAFVEAPAEAWLPAASFSRGSASDAEMVEQVKSGL